MQRVLFALLAAALLSAAIGPLAASAVNAAQPRATPVVEVTPLPAKASEVPAAFHPLWKAEVVLNKAVAREFCMNSAAQGIIKLNLGNGQSLSGAVSAWFQVSGGVNPMVLKAAQGYIGAYTGVTKSGVSVPEWAYPADPIDGVAIDRVIDQISQTQFKGCNLGTYH